MSYNIIMKSRRVNHRAQFIGATVVATFSLVLVCGMLSIVGSEGVIAGVTPEGKRVDVLLHQGENGEITLDPSLRYGETLLVTDRTGYSARLGEGDNLQPPLVESITLGLGQLSPVDVWKLLEEVEIILTTENGDKECNLETLAEGRAGYFCP